MNQIKIKYLCNILVTIQKNRTACPEAHLDQEQQSLKPPADPHRPWFFFNAVNKLWYVKGDCGLWSSFLEIVCVVQTREHICTYFGGKTQPVDSLMSADFDAVNKLWYITGEECCVQVSSKSCVSFRKREQIIILGVKSPPVDPFNERKFWCGRYTLVHHGWSKLWSSFIKIVCVVWEETANTYFGGVNPYLRSP